MVPLAATLRDTYLKYVCYVDQDRCVFILSHAVIVLEGEYSCSARSNPPVPPS